MSSESSDNEAVATLLLFMAAISTKKLKRNEGASSVGTHEWNTWSVRNSCRRASPGGRD